MTAPLMPGAAQPEMWRDIITTCFRPSVSDCTAAAGVRDPCQPTHQHNSTAVVWYATEQLPLLSLGDGIGLGDLVKTR